MGTDTGERLERLEVRSRLLAEPLWDTSEVRMMRDRKGGEAWRR